MKLTAKTLTLAALFGLGTGLLLPMTGNSQPPASGIRIPRVGPNINSRINPTNQSSQLGSAIIHAPVIPALPTEMDKLNDRLAALEERLAAQDRKIAAQELKIAAQQKALDSTNATVFARPAGYTRAFITLSNFGHLPGTDAISYWARN